MFQLAKKTWSDVVKRKCQLGKGGLVFRPINSKKFLCMWTNDASIYDHIEVKVDDRIEFWTPMFEAKGWNIDEIQAAVGLTSLKRPFK